MPWHGGPWRSTNHEWPIRTPNSKMSSWLSTIISTPGKLLGGIVNAITPGRALGSPNSTSSPAPKKILFGSASEAMNESKDDDVGPAHFGAHFMLEPWDENAPPQDKGRKAGRGSPKRRSVKRSVSRRAAMPKKKKTLKKKEKAAASPKRRKRPEPRKMSPARVKLEPMRRNKRRSTRRAQKSGFYTQSRLEACVWKGKGTAKSPITFLRR